MNAEFQKAQRALDDAWKRFDEAITPAEIYAATYELRGAEIRHDELYLKANGREYDASRLIAPRRLVGAVN